MTIVQFKDWLKTQVTAELYSTNALRGDTTKSQIVVYNGRGYINPLSVGQVSSYRGKGLRILIHWNKSTDESERKAHEVYNLLHGKDYSIEGTRVVMFNMRDPEPVFLGQDEHGILEYVIDVEAIIERS